MIYKNLYNIALITFTLIFFTSCAEEKAKDTQIVVDPVIKLKDNTQPQQEVQQLTKPVFNACLSTGGIFL